MAVETRPELVGKRFLCLGGEEPPESGRWRAGVIRAVSQRDSHSPDLAVRAAARAGPRGCGGGRWARRDTAPRPAGLSDVEPRVTAGARRGSLRRVRPLRAPAVQPRGERAGAWPGRRGTIGLPLEQQGRMRLIQGNAETAAA